MFNDAQAERFKWAMLRVAVGDPPWHTGMAWADAMDGLPGRTRAEIDRVVQESLMELLDAGYIYFYRPTRSKDEFAEWTEADALDRREVQATLAQGSEEPPTDDLVFLPGGLMWFRATEAGCDYFAGLPDDASRLFPPRD